MKNGDPDRLARFQREAELLATLTHANIAGIHGLEEGPAEAGPYVASVGRALVLELVEGPTLADRIAEGPLPLEDALPIARQIADALEAAHGRGIVHRDLKPANIKITPDGVVKVLDFGLAKLLDTSPAASSLSMSPTLSLHATHQGVILGTAAYIADARLEIEETLHTPAAEAALLAAGASAPHAAPHSRSRWAATGGLAILAAVLAIPATLYLWQPAPERLVTRLDAVVPAGLDPVSLALSPPPRPRRAAGSDRRRCRRWD